MTKRNWILCVTLALCLLGGLFPAHAEGADAVTGQVLEGIAAAHTEEWKMGNPAQLAKVQHKDDALMALFDALAAGETLAAGAKGDGARALQQLLSDIGCDVTVDGSAGKKTFAVLDALKAAAGLEPTGALDAEGLAFLIRLYAELQDSDAAQLYPEPDAAERYALAGALAHAGHYYFAQKQYLAAGDYQDAPERAASCVQPMPKKGPIVGGAKGSAKLAYLTTRADGEGTVLLVKAVESYELIASAFLPGSDKLTIKVPEGGYVLYAGTGTEWFGKDAFGAQGSYGKIAFSGHTALWLSSGTLQVSLAQQGEDGYNPKIEILTGTHHLDFIAQ